MFKFMLVLLGLGLVSQCSNPSIEMDMGNMAMAPAPVTIHTAVFADQVTEQQVSDEVAFETVNGISLQDQIQDVLTKKGEPLNIEEIPILGCTEYEYKDATIGICDDWVSYVHIENDAGTFIVNGQHIEISESGIAEALGASEFIADDGEVFIRGEQAIKVFSDSKTGKIEFIEFFDNTSF
ncbi:hypothetical protein [Paenibacillus sp. CMAA1364]